MEKTEAQLQRVMNNRDFKQRMVYLRRAQDCQSTAGKFGFSMSSCMLKKAEAFKGCCIVSFQASHMQLHL